MRIAFVTTGLEPGKDGVGDYTRDLAAACIRAGHSCAIVALNDRFVDRTREEMQRARGTDVLAFRLPMASTWPERWQLARLWLGRQSPDTLSLQFVPYGFHPKGLVTGLGERLATLTAGRRVHVMFHELWIGAHLGASLGHRLMGWAQRRAVVALVKRLVPAVIHTSNPAYQALAGAAGFKARRLPLCGSIQVLQAPEAHWIDDECARLGVGAEFLKPRERCMWFGFFGSLHPQWAPEPLFTYIGAAAQRMNKKVLMLSIGRQGPGAELWRELQFRYASRFAFAQLGERTTEQVSAFLQSIDLGVATTPWQIIGKSATVAAMLDHGVPVIVSRDDVHLRLPADVEPAAEPLLYKMSVDLPQWLAAASPRRPPRDGLTALARTFLADLGAEPARNRRSAA